MPRLYLTNTAAPYTPATFKGAWAILGNAVTRSLSPTKSGTTALVNAAIGVVSGGATSCAYRGVSDALTSAAVVSLTDAVIQMRESVDTANVYARVHVWVSVGDSDTVRGTVVNQWVAASELSTSYLGRRLQATSSSVSASIGDRIVVEVGGQTAEASSFTVSVRYGGTGTDAVEGNSTSTYVGWLDLTLDTPVDPPTIDSTTCDIHGGVTLALTESSTTTTGMKVYASTTAGGTYTQVTAPNLIVTEGAAGAWTAFIPRPDLILGGFTGTLYLRVYTTTATNDSANYSASSVAVTQDRSAVIASHADVTMAYALSRAESGVPQYVEPAVGSYKSAPLMVRAECYALNTGTHTRSQMLATIEAQWDYLKTWADANGIVKQISDTYPNQLSADAHYRACFHSYAAAMLLKANGETTLSAEILDQVDTWAVNYLTYCRLINNDYGEVVFAYSNDNGATWVVQNEANQQLWGGMVLSCLYNDPYSALYHSTATYASRTGGAGPHTIPQIVSGVVANAHRSQDTDGFILYTTGRNTGYHLASMISLRSILAKFGAEWDATLDHLFDGGMSCMTTGDARFYDEDSNTGEPDYTPDFEWNDERNYLYESQTTYTDPFPGCNLSWCRHNYDDGHAGSYGKYQASDDYTVANPWIVAIDGMLANQAYADVLWAPPPEAPYRRRRTLLRLGGF